MIVYQNDQITCFICNRVYDVNQGAEHANYHRYLNANKREQRTSLPPNIKNVADQANNELSSTVMNSKTGTFTPLKRSRCASSVDVKNRIIKQQTENRFQSIKDGSGLEYSLLKSQPMERNSNMVANNKSGQTHSSMREGIKFRQQNEQRGYHKLQQQNVTNERYTGIIPKFGVLDNSLYFKSVPKHKKNIIPNDIPIFTSQTNPPDLFSTHVYTQRMIRVHVEKNTGDSKINNRNSIPNKQKDGKKNMSSVIKYAQKTNGKNQRIQQGMMNHMKSTQKEQQSSVIYNYAFQSKRSQNASRRQSIYNNLQDTNLDNSRSLSKRKRIVHSNMQARIN